MSIRVTCTTCQNLFLVKDSLAGRRGACPNCNGLLTIPGVAARPSEAGPAKPPSVGKSSPVAAGAPAIAAEPPRHDRPPVKAGERATPPQSTQQAVAGQATDPPQPRITTNSKPTSPGATPAKSPAQSAPRTPAKSTSSHAANATAAKPDEANEELRLAPLEPDQPALLFDEATLGLSTDSDSPFSSEAFSFPSTTTGDAPLGLKSADEENPLGLKLTDKEKADLAKAKKRAEAVKNAKYVGPAAALRQVMAAQAQKFSREQIFGSFQGPIEPVELQPFYRLGVVLVGLVMVLLPLIYIGIIVLVAFGVTYHAVHDTAILAERDGQRHANTAVLILYLGPLVIGAILVAFMIKPLFAKRQKREKPRSLAREQEPLLFEFVDRICAAVGSPKPARIDVDCQVNASAGLRNGLLSMFHDDLVLTIGLPLVAGLSMRELGGVLAHEFGHFSQATAMRFGYLNYSIANWFARVAYERDAWDERLYRMAQQLGLPYGIVFWAAIWLVTGTRKLLWGLMMTGRGIGGFLSREMEFHADCYEARLAGSETFCSTNFKMYVLEIATRGAYDDLGQFYREGRLADDLPRLIQANVAQMPAHVFDDLREAVEKLKTHWYDTHPSYSDRNRAAMELAAPGVFRLEAPATCLFADFTALAKSTTFDFYRANFGEEFRPQAMHPVEVLLVKQDQQGERYRLLHRYFQKAFHPYRPLLLSSGWLEKPKSGKQALEALKTAREKSLKMAEYYDEMCRKFVAIDDERVEIVQSIAVLRSGLKVNPTTFSLPLTSLNKARTENERNERELAQVVERLNSFERFAGERLYAALTLLHHSQVAGRLANSAAWLTDCEQLLPVAVSLPRQLKLVYEMRDLRLAFAILYANISGNQQNPSLLEEINRVFAKLQAQFSELRQTTSSLTYPFSHGKGAISIADYLVPETPTKDDIGSVMNASEMAQDRFIELYARVISQLVEYAAAVEKVVGLPDLPDPEEKK